MVSQGCSRLTNKEGQQNESEQGWEVHSSCAQNHGDLTLGSDLGGSEHVSLGKMVGRSSERDHDECLRPGLGSFMRVFVGAAVGQRCNYSLVMDSNERLVYREDTMSEIVIFHF